MTILPQEPIHRAAAATTLIVFFGLFFPESPVVGQSVQGRVIDPEVGPLAGAVIEVRLESRELVTRAESDEVGNFQFGSLDPGEYFLIVERLGYQTTRSLLSLREGDSISIELRLEVEAIPLEPIIVTASSRPAWEHLQPPALWEFWERKEHMEKLGVGSFFTYEDIKPVVGQKTAQIVADFAPFFFTQAHPDRRSDYFIRGRGRCYPPIYLDGHLLRGTPVFIGGQRLEEPPILDDWIQSSGIAAIEIYRGGSSVPGEFRATGSNCGVVAVWSHRGIRR